MVKAKAHGQGEWRRPMFVALTMSDPNFLRTALVDPRLLQSFSRVKLFLFRVCSTPVPHAWNTQAIDVQSKNTVCSNVPRFPKGYESDNVRPERRQRASLLSSVSPRMVYILPKTVEHGTTYIISVPKYNYYYYYI